MSSKSSTKSQAYTVEQACLTPEQHTGKAETVKAVGVIGVHGKPRASVTLDTNFGGGVTHVWLRFSSVSPALDTHLKAHGWHFSPKNRQGYHRQADAQADKFVSELKLVPEAAVTQVQAPAEKTPAGKTGSKVAGKVAQAQEVASKGKTATHTKASELGRDELIAKLEVALGQMELQATMCRLLVEELKSRA